MADLHQTGNYWEITFFFLKIIDMLITILCLYNNVVLAMTMPI